MEQKLFKLSIQTFAEPNDPQPQGDPKGETPPPKTFTQDEVNAIVQEREARAKKGQLTAEEIAEYKQFKESQKTQEEKTQELLAEREARILELEKKSSALEQKTIIVDSKALDVEYVTFKVNQLVTSEKDFATALEEFKTTNPQYFQSEEKEVAKGKTIFQTNNPKGGEPTDPAWLNILKDRHNLK